MTTQYTTTIPIRKAGTPEALSGEGDGTHVHVPLFANPEATHVRVPGTDHVLKDTHLASLVSVKILPGATNRYSHSIAIDATGVEGDCTGQHTGKKHAAVIHPGTSFSGFEFKIGKPEMSSKQHMTVINYTAANLKEGVDKMERKGETVYKVPKTHPVFRAIANRGTEFNLDPAAIAKMVKSSGQVVPIHEDTFNVVAKSLEDGLEKFNLVNLPKMSLTLSPDVPADKTGARKWKDQFCLRESHNSYVPTSAAGIPGEAAMHIQLTYAVPNKHAPAPAPAGK